jgi:Zn-dependent protease
MFNLSLERVREGTVFLIALILSIAVHEFGHAFVADRLGDGTPRSQGRVTLNPIAHIDPIGTLLFPIVAFVSSTGILFGWGKPVQIYPPAFSRRFSMKMGHLLVAIAGPAMNVILAIVVTIVYAVLLYTRAMPLDHPIVGGIAQVIFLNWGLAFFNLIPCPPLDGGAVLAGLLPDKYDGIIEVLRQYGFMILLGLLITGAVGFFMRPALYIAALTLGAVHTLVLS